jgi:uncharacterized protein
MKKILLDVNVWVAIVVEVHPLHQVAVDWFAAQEPGSLILCRVTQLGLLRLLCNPRVTQPPLTPAEAWQAERGLRLDSRVVFEAEPEDLQELWRGLTNPLRAISTNAWTDAYLAAFAIARDYRLTTFDAGMSRWSQLSVELLRPTGAL